jgi:hypothetical protein
VKVLEVLLTHDGQNWMSRYLRFDRAIVYTYLACVVVVAAFTLDDRAQWSQALWNLKPWLEPVARITEFAFTPAVVGLMVCPFAILLMALRQRIATGTAVASIALFLCSILLLIPAIQ